MGPTKEQLKTWVSALYSGEYKQCQGKLMHEDLNGEKSYCCLGVYAAAVLKRKPHRIRDKKLLANNIIPLAIQKRLAEMNDRGETFNYIARYIENYGLLDGESGN